MELYFYNECGYSRSVLNCITNLHCEDKIIKKNIRENPEYEKELIALTGAKTVPVLVIDGKPLRYRLKDEQHFLLYSVGLDGKDNGGDPTEGPEQYNVEGKNTGRDWVYPELATSEEIAADQEKARKRRSR